MTYAIVLMVVAAAGWFSLDQPAGPITETTGVVQTVGRLSSGELGASRLVANIRLRDGALVQANVSPAVAAETGQVATIRVYRRVLSGNHVYEMTGIVARQ